MAGKIRWIDETGSTNSDALRMAEEGAEEGTIICAATQHHGRGQRGTAWVSEPGMNLTFSMIFYPLFLDLAHFFYLNVFASLAIKDYLSSLTGKNFTIKWPNDIYYADRKLGGILIENTVREKKICTAVVGIGLNINQEKFPAGIPNPVSLKQLAERNYPLHEILNGLSTSLLSRYREMQNGLYSPLMTAYNTCLYRINIPSSFIANNIQFRGTIQCVEADGRLVVLNERGEIKRFFFKEIAFDVPAGKAG